ncbi:MAG: hypothetical protein HYY26_02445 [Acidobacteria bacterium]|nr:hypothetical protein [Acidobacteriota bacterium]
MAEIDLERVSEEKLALDVGGHYARPDIFDLQVRRQPLVPFRTAKEKRPRKKPAANLEWKAEAFRYGGRDMRCSGTLQGSTSGFLCGSLLCGQNLLHDL